MTFSEDGLTKGNVEGMPQYTYYDALKCLPYFMDLLSNRMERKMVVNEDEIFID